MRLEFAHVFTKKNRHGSRKSRMQLQCPKSNGTVRGLKSNRGHPSQPKLEGRAAVFVLPLCCPVHASKCSMNMGLCSFSRKFSSFMGTWKELMHWSTSCGRATSKKNYSAQGTWYFIIFERDAFCSISKCARTTSFCTGAGSLLRKTSCLQCTSYVARPNMYPAQ